MLPTFYISMSFRFIQDRDVAEPIGRLEASLLVVIPVRMTVTWLSKAGKSTSVGNRFADIDPS